LLVFFSFFLTIVGYMGIRTGLLIGKLVTIKFYLK
jgi:hypothetical protein